MAPKKKVAPKKATRKKAKAAAPKKGGKKKAPSLKKAAGGAGATKKPKPKPKAKQQKKKKPTGKKANNNNNSKKKKKVVAKKATQAAAPAPAPGPAPAPKKAAQQQQLVDPNPVSAVSVTAALQIAVQRLRVGTTTPVGRQHELDTVLNFIRNPTVVSNVMQLFGMPGTGKTAVVKHALSVASATAPGLSYVFLNGFLLQKPGELYCRLWQHLSKVRLGDEQLLVPEAAAAALELRFRDRGWPNPAALQEFLSKKRKELKTKQAAGARRQRAAAAAKQKQKAAAKKTNNKKKKKKETSSDDDDDLLSFDESSSSEDEEESSSSSCEDDDDDNDDDDDDDDVQQQVEQEHNAQQVAGATEAMPWCCVIVIDEVDKLYETQAGLRTFFRLLEYLELNHCYCRLLTMANSMALPDFSQKARSRVSTTNHQRINFRAYTERQLADILFDRVKGITPTIFNAMAVEHVCKNVANTNGDVRRMLQTCSVVLHEYLSMMETAAGHLARYEQQYKLQQSNAGKTPAAILAALNATVQKPEFQQQLTKARSFALPTTLDEGIVRLEDQKIFNVVRRLLFDPLPRLFEGEALPPLHKVAVCVLVAQHYKHGDALTVTMWRRAVVEALQKHGKALKLDLILAIPGGAPPGGGAGAGAGAGAAGAAVNAATAAPQNMTQQQQQAAAASATAGMADDLEDSDWYGLVSFFRELAIIEISQSGDGGRTRTAVGRTEWDIAFYANPSRCFVTVMQNPDTMRAQCQNKLPEYHDHILQQTTVKHQREDARLSQMF